MEERGDPFFYSQAAGSVFHRNVGDLPTRRQNPQIRNGVWKFPDMEPDVHDGQKMGRWVQLCQIQ